MNYLDMEALILSGTENTPSVVLDPAKDSYVFEGDSRPENVQSFYGGILEWFENWGEYLKTQAASGKVEKNVVFKLEYFNSSSAKFIMDIILRIKEINGLSPNISMQVTWMYDEDDEDMIEVGEEFEALTDVSFKFVTY